MGIDLGTTNSLIACFMNSQPTIIPNVFGENLTPSIVSVMDDGQISVGKIAKERLISHPQMTAAVFKRSMGTKKQFKLGEKVFTAEELSSFVVKKLKEDAEIFLGEKIEEAIISVPAYFNDVQRRATKLAGELAGLKVERIVNEPTAAALAYGFHEEQDYTKFLVFDLGGGTFDVSVLEKYDNIMEVRAVAGDIFLGGEDFTEILEKIFLDKTKLNFEDLSDSDKAVLKKSIETAKHSFSRSNIKITSTIQEKTYEANVLLNEYTSKCEDLLTRLRTSIKVSMNDAKISLDQIDNIILSGGATNLPIIKDFVGKLFRRIPLSSINPDEVVGVGAAVHAALKERDEAVSEIILTDVCPFTLGVESSSKQPNGIFYHDLYSPIIERNTIIPVSRVERFFTLHDNQSIISFKIFQGESRKASENSFMGELSIPIPKAPAGQEGADVRFTYNINGILEVEVTVVSSGLKKTLVIDRNPGVFTQDEIKQKLNELAAYKIHPREKEENRFLISRGERLYQESLGSTRITLGMELTNFDAVLDSQDERKIRDFAIKFKKILDDLDG